MDYEENKMEEARQWSTFVMDDVMLMQSKQKMKEKLQQLQKDLDEVINH